MDVEFSSLLCKSQGMVTINILYSLKSSKNTVLEGGGAFTSSSSVYTSGLCYAAAAAAAHIYIFINTGVYNEAGLCQEQHFLLPERGNKRAGAPLEQRGIGLWALLRVQVVTEDALQPHSPGSRRLVPFTVASQSLGHFPAPSPGVPVSGSKLRLNWSYVESLRIRLAGGGRGVVQAFGWINAELSRFLNIRFGFA